MLPIALLAAAACRRPAPSGEQQEDTPLPAAAVPSAAASASPVDHLAPGELVEGHERAFGVVLPNALHVNASFVDVAYASGSASVHALAQYFRARLQDGSMREGPQAATFEHVRVRGQPGVELLVHIGATAEGARVEIRNSTPPPAPNLPDEPARWKQVGLTAHGHLADPTHLD